MVPPELPYYTVTLVCCNVQNTSPLLNACGHGYTPNTIITLFGLLLMSVVHEGSVAQLAPFPRSLITISRTTSLSHCIYHYHCSTFSEKCQEFFKISGWIRNLKRTPAYSNAVLLLRYADIYPIVKIALYKFIIPNSYNGTV